MSEPGIRQYSTNHLLGEGYWVWLIPLSTGPISIGVCADPRFHPFEEIASSTDAGLARRSTSRSSRAAIEPRLGRRRGLPAGRGLRLRRRAGVLARSLVPGGRGGRVRRPVLLAGLGLHRLRQHASPATSSRATSTARTSPSASSTTTTSTSAPSTTCSRRYEDQYPVFGNPWVVSRSSSGTRSSTTPAWCC